MTRLSVGCGVSAIRIAMPASVPVSITAALPPAMSALYAGQAVGDVPGYAAMAGAANFASSAGPIASAVVSFTGDAVSATGALAEDDTAGFTVAVTDSAANLRVFTATPVAVQYRVRGLGTAGNEAGIDINPLVGDAVALGDIIIAGSGAYDATYSGITAGNLRHGPFNLGASSSAGLPQISGTTGLGDTLTADDGLWTTPTGTLTLTRQWQADGVDIPGATGTTFDITASEQGADITVEVSGDDGVHAPVVAESAPVGIPGGAAPWAHEVAGDMHSITLSAGTGTMTIPGITLSVGRKIVVVRRGHVSGDARRLNGVPSFNGATGDFHVVGGAAANARFVQAYIGAVDVTAGGTAAITIPLDSNEASDTRHDLILDVFDVTGLAALAADEGGASSLSDVPLAADTVAGGIAIVAIATNLDRSFAFANATQNDNTDMHQDGAVFSSALAIDEAPGTATARDFTVVINEGSTNRVSASVVAVEFS